MISVQDPIQFNDNVIFYGGMKGRIKKIIGEMSRIPLYEIEAEIDPSLSIGRRTLFTQDEFKKI